MLEWCPDIDAMIGVFDRDRILEAVSGSRADRSDLSTPVPVYSSIAANATVAWQQRNAPNDSIQDVSLTVKGQGYFEDDTSRLRLTPRHYAYLRMSEGCNQNCAFCTIPSIRGKMRSKPVDHLIAEMQELIRDGAFELNLIGQDTTSYGEDIGYKPGLAGLLRELDKAAAQATGGSLPGAWLRLMYAYPSAFTDEMIDAIAALPRIVKYIDMPLQHINDRVLDSMRRKTSRKLIETLLAKLRNRIPGIAIRTRTRGT
jgi:ribosomal protein S12 methylthiotransferase